MPGCYICSSHPIKGQDIQRKSPKYIQYKPLFLDYNRHLSCRIYFSELITGVDWPLKCFKRILMKKKLLMIFINIQISYTSIKLNLLPDQLTILILVENWVESDLVFNHMSDYKIMVVWFVSHEYDYRLTSDDTKSTYQLIIKIKIFKKHKK